MDASWCKRITKGKRQTSRRTWDFKTSRGVTFEVQLTQNRELGLEIIDRSLAMGHRITSVLSALNIDRSTYYQWKNWHPSQQETRRNALKTTIKAVYNTNRGIYGYRRIDAFLRFILNTEVGDRLVWELMNEMSLTSRMVRKSYKKPTTTNVWST